MSKEELLKAITEECTKAVNLNTTTLTLYYSGHGRKGDGAWKTTKEGSLEMHFDAEEIYIELHEILNAIIASGYKNNLEITSDSCYSGELCLIAQKLWL